MDISTIGKIVSEGFSVYCNTSATEEDPNDIAQILVDAKVSFVFAFLKCFCSFLFL